MASIIPIKSSMFSTRVHQGIIPLCEDCEEENPSLADEIYQDLIAGAQVAEEERGTA